MSWPGGVSERKAVLGLAALATVPTIVWGFFGAGYLSDDYWIAYWLDDFGLLEGTRQIALEYPARPLAAPYYVLIYSGLGQVAALQILVLAAVNAFMMVALWRFGREFLRPDVLLIALAVFAVLPNRASTRLWFVVGSYPLAVGLVALGGVWLLRRQFLAGGLAIVTAILLYEGVAGFAAAVLVVVAWRRRVDLRAVLITTAPVLSSVGLMYLISPKRKGAAASEYQLAFDQADTLAPAQFADGIAQSATLGTALYVGVVATVVWAVVRAFPSFRADGDGLHLIVLAGIALTFVGAGPMLMGGSQFAFEGLNDRNNLVPSIGASLVMAVPLLVLGRGRRSSALVVVPLVLLAALVSSVRDVDQYRSAQTVGRELAQTVHRSAPDHVEDVDDVVVIVPALDLDDGVGTFVNHIDIQGAMHLRTGDGWSFLRMALPYDCDGARAGDRYFDWRTGQATERAATDVHAQRECRRRR